MMCKECGSKDIKTIGSLYYKCQKCGYEFSGCHYCDRTITGNIENIPYAKMEPLSKKTYTLRPDKLEELFKLQKEFQNRYGYWPELHQVASAGASEFLELWAKADGKWWKKHGASKEEQKDELADILHFFLIACLKLEITPQELFDAYKAKLGVNYKRQKDGY